MSFSLGIYLLLLDRVIPVPRHHPIARDLNRLRGDPNHRKCVAHPQSWATLPRCSGHFLLSHMP